MQYYRLPCFILAVHFLYVCVCSYLSASLDDGEQASLQQAVDRGWPASLHLIGKVGFRKLYFAAVANIHIPCFNFEKNTYASPSLF
jgi:hypothetical protein